MELGPGLKAAFGKAWAMLTGTRGAGTQAEAFEGMLGTLEASIAASEKVAEHLVMYQSEQQERYVGGGKGRLIECRAMSQIKVLATDKSVYKQWNERLISTMACLMGRCWRFFLFALNKKLDEKNKVLTKEELQDMDEYEGLRDVEVMDENPYAVLLEKTEGEALTKVTWGVPGEGFNAYMRIHLWFAGTTGLALSERT